MRKSLALVALLLGVLAASSAAAATRPARAASRGPLPWIADDYPKAVALAKARHLPIFVENWAPW